jgi:sugar lactone lactonase YvrE
VALLSIPELNSFPNDVVNNRLFYLLKDQTPFKGDNAYEWSHFGNILPARQIVGPGVSYNVSSPVYIAIDSCGNAWITNGGGTTVTKLSPKGVVIGTYTVGNSPVGIAIDASGNVWVVNNLGGTVTKLSPTGAAIGTFTVGSSPTGIAIDASGNVWVTNTVGSTVT